MKTIRARLVLFFTLICVGGLIIAGMSGVAVAKKALMLSTDEKKSTEAKYYASAIDGWMSSEAATVVNGAEYLQNAASIDKEHVSEYLMEMTKASDNVGNVYTGYDKKLFWECTGSIPEDFDATGRGWYQAAKAADTEVYTDPYIDIATNAMVVTIAKGFTRNDGWSGVMGMP